MRAAGSSLATVRSFSATAVAREPALVCSWQAKRPAPEWNRRVPPEFLQSRAREGAETGLAREVMGERIRDKIAASKKKGI